MDQQTEQSTGENSHDPDNLIPTTSLVVVDIHRLISEDIVPKLLKESAGLKSCCIARIPQSLARIDLKAYDLKDILKERRVLEDYYGTSDGVSQFYKNIGNEVAFDINKSHLAKVFEGLNEYTSKGFHVYCAEFVHTHFDSPWTFASSFAALLLLMFAALICSL